MNKFIKVLTISAILLTTQANAWYCPCEADGDFDNRDEIAAETAERNKANEGESRGSSAKQDAEVAAKVEKAIKDFKDKGIKDLDEIHNWDLTSTEAEREAGRCYVKTWYGKKEVNCDKK